MFWGTWCTVAVLKDVLTRWGQLCYPRLLEAQYGRRNRSPRARPRFVSSRRNGGAFIFSLTSPLPSLKLGQWEPPHSWSQACFSSFQLTRRNAILLAVSINNSIAAIRWLRCHSCKTIRIRPFFLPTSWGQCGDTMNSWDVLREVMRSGLCVQLGMQHGSNKELNILAEKQALHFPRGTFFRHLRLALL